MKNIGLGLLLVIVHVACYAQVSDSIVHPEVRVEAQRIAEAIGSSAATIDSMSYALLRSKGLTQLLESESFISTRAFSPGGTANFSVRGTGSQHTQVVWDGIPINDPMLGQTDLSTITLNGVSSVRVLYGSAGLTNNSGGIGGTIELTPIEMRSNDGLDVNLSLSAGSFGNYGLSLQVRDRYKLVSGSTSIEYHQGKNNFRYSNLASLAKEDRFLEHAAFKRLGVSKTMSVQLNQRNTLSASVLFSQVGKELPPTMLMVASEETLFDLDILASLKWRRIGKRATLTFTSAYVYGNQRYFDNNAYTFHHLYQANKNLFRYKRVMGHDLHLEIGGDVFFEHARSDSSYRSEPHWRYGQAVFASLKYVPKKWVSAQALIREDVIDAQFSPIQGVVGVEVRPVKYLIIKGNVSRKFRSPTLNDLYWVPGGNTDLKSETGLSWEAGIGVKAGSKVLKFNFEATYFRSDIDNWIIWLPMGNVWTPQNKRAVTSTGAETQLKLSSDLGKITLRLNAGYTFVSSTVVKGNSGTDASVGKQLIYVPLHQAKANLSIHFGKLFLQYGHQFTGLRYTTSDNKSSLPGYQISFVSMGYGFTLKRQTVSLNLTIDNLFDKDYQTIAWRPMPGRSFLFNLTYQFN
jgi:iron complex outermembrane receptor protein